MKLSKFNYFQKKDNKLLLYNAMRGRFSMIKVMNDDAERIYYLLANPQGIDMNREGKLLYKYGFLVDESLDEDRLCESITWKRMFNSTLSLVIMPTEDCNFRCSYCYEEHKNGVMSMNIANAVISYIKKNITKYTSLHITWFGGEPLLNTETCHIIEEISKQAIEICRSFHKSYSADIITNGYNLNLDTFLFLLKNRVFSFQVTIDGNSEHHDKYRALYGIQPTHDIIIDNLIKIKESKKKFFKIIIRTNISEDMIDDLEPHFVKLYEKFGNDNRFGFFIRPVGNWGGVVVNDIADNILSTSKYREIYRKIQNMNCKLDFSRHAFFYDNATCPACYENSFIIGSNGKIHKCSCELDNEINDIGFVDCNSGECTGQPFW